MSGEVITSGTLFLFLLQHAGQWNHLRTGASFWNTHTLMGTHKHARVCIRFLLAHLKDGWSWNRMEPAMRAFKGEEWMDHNSCGTLLDGAVVDGHYVEPGVMTKLWLRHQSFHTMRSIWTDINSIKQITVDGGDKDLSGLMWRCMASSHVNTLWHAIFLQQICSANEKDIFVHLGLLRVDYISLLNKIEICFCPWCVILGVKSFTSIRKKRK